MCHSDLTGKIFRTVPRNRLCFVMVYGVRTSESVWQRHKTVNGAKHKLKIQLMQKTKMGQPSLPSLMVYKLNHAEYI